MRSPLLWTLIASVALLCGVGGWLLADPATSRSEALKTAGLAGGAVVALYALWLNDRRRRVEEARQAIEQQRHDVDRERISDERFAKSVELLGHEADQVRVGALHALAGLARTRPEYRQTVLDVLCSYLRRPFMHGRYEGVEGTAEEKRELQVRLTAQRLIRDLLPPSDVDGPGPDLDLTGAVLEYFDLSRRRIGGLLLRHASLYSSTNLSGSVFTGQAYFTAAGTGPGRLVGVSVAATRLFSTGPGSPVPNSRNGPISPTPRSPVRPPSRARPSRRKSFSTGRRSPVRWRQRCRTAGSWIRRMAAMSRCRSE